MNKCETFKNVEEYEFIACCELFRESMENAVAKLVHKRIKGEGDCPEAYRVAVQGSAWLNNSRRQD